MQNSTKEIIQLVTNGSDEEAEEKANTMASHFGIVQLFGIAIAVTNGFLIDKCK